MILKWPSVRIIHETCTGDFCPNCESSLKYGGCLLPVCDNYYKKKGFGLIDNTIVHKTKLKCFINPLLRCIQCFTDRPYVITSMISRDNNECYLFEGYTFKRVKYIRG